MRTCKKCLIEKPLSEFYSSQGRTRRDCKKCTIRKNVRYQQKTEAWKHRYINDKGYRKSYYAKNKEKFVKYRRKFKENNPFYHKEYLMKKKNPRKTYVIDR